MTVAVQEPRTENTVGTLQRRVLVVDDSPIDRRLAGRIVERAYGLTVPSRWHSNKTEKLRSLCRS